MNTPGEGTLHDDDGHDGSHHTGAERGREGDCGKAVQHRFEDELIGSPPQTIRERAEDGQRANTEDQRCRDKPFDEALAGSVFS